MRHHPWIIFDGNEQSHVCLRCGKREWVDLPKSVSMFVARAKVFMRKHADCEPAIPNRAPSGGGVGAEPPTSADTKENATAPETDQVE